MADIFVRSTDGNDADSGATWALAKATITGAAAIDAAGDNIYVSQAHEESTAASVTFAFAGTAANPVKIIGSDDASEPPTTVSTAATITTTGASSISISGHAYFHGLTFNAGSGANSSSLIVNNFGAESVVFNQCSLKLVATGSANTIRFGQINDGSTQKITLKDTHVKFAATAQRINLRANVSWDGGTVLSGSSAVTSVFVFGGRNCSQLQVSGVDFSALGAGVFLVDESVRQSAKAVFRNCKLPTSWTGGLFSATPSVIGMRAEMHNCDSADTNYRLWVEDYAGSVKSETTVARTGGASDGTTAYSWKMTSSANANETIAPLESPELPARWNSTAGSAVTVTVDVVHDSVTNLTDSEIWLEIQYLGTTGFPLSSFVSDARANILATSADQTASTATWTTTGMTNPNKQKLSVTFTPQEAGFIQAKVFLSKPSKTVYVDPKLQVS